MSIPEYLINRKQWVGFKLVEIPGKTKPKKIPLNPHYGIVPEAYEMASVSDSSTWGSYQECRKFPLQAYCLTKEDGLVFVDLDNVLNAMGRIVHPAAYEIKEMLKTTHWGLSVSETGLHFIGKGKLKRNHAKAMFKGLEFEVYNQNRFMIVSEYSEGPLLNIQVQLDELLPKQKKRHFRHSESGEAGVNHERATLQDVLKALDKLNPDSDYDTWYKIGMALHSWAKETGLTVWNEWSQNGEKHQPGECERKWRSFDIKPGESISIGTLFHYAAEAEEIWEEPTPLPSMSSVQPFDFDMLPDVLSTWVKDVARSLQCPPDYIAIPTVICMASLIGKKVAVRPKKKAAWTEVVNMWGGVVGDSGTRKSAALQWPINLLHDIEGEEQEEHKGSLSEFEQRKTTWGIQDKLTKKAIMDARAEGKKKEACVLERQLTPCPRLPGEPRLVYNTSSVARLGEILRDNPNGLLLERDELTGWLVSLEKERELETRSFYLEAWYGKNPHVCDTISRGKVRVTALVLSIVGGIQPLRVQKYLTDRDEITGDGFLPRFQLLVWPDPMKNRLYIDEHPDDDTQKEVVEIFKWLREFRASKVLAQGLKSPFPYMRLSNGALALFRPWHEVNERRLEDDDMQPGIKAYLAKLPATIASLALIFHLSERRKAAVGETAMAKALLWAPYLESHTRRLYDHQGSAPLSAAQRLLKIVRAGKLEDCFTARDVYHNHWKDLDNKGRAKGALDTLVEHRWLKAELRRTKGRSTWVHRINPLCFSVISQDEVSKVSKHQKATTSDTSGTPTTESVEVDKPEGLGKDDAFEAIPEEMVSGEEGRVVA